MDRPFPALFWPLCVREVLRQAGIWVRQHHLRYQRDHSQGGYGGCRQLPPFRLLQVKTVPLQFPWLQCGWVKWNKKEGVIGTKHILSQIIVYEYKTQEKLLHADISKIYRSLYWWREADILAGSRHNLRISSKVLVSLW